ncbi:hypothetical protein GALMADRAFT_139730 [Galerina marginata CBS 339.88]|uniref:Uncharacterized protein n=1 Tax=Galerina marginata (strain CBS 339.88) TaxID=685588 RepID=A0A067SYI1_GALM3|nr:hypothetical protein GALMADRAFT_139730 [Galerina marginata CBS 339.88]
MFPAPHNFTNSFEYLKIIMFPATLPNSKLKDFTSQPSKVLYLSHIKPHNDPLPLTSLEISDLRPETVPDLYKTESPNTPLLNPILNNSQAKTQEPESVEEYPHLSNFFLQLRPNADEEDLEVSYDPTIHEDDEYIFYPNTELTENNFPPTLTAYKRADKKKHPVSTSFPEDCRVTRQIPEDPLLTLPTLPFNPPEFTPTSKISHERMGELNVNSTGFLWPEEEKLFQYVMTTNEGAIAFEDAECGTLKESYFSPYIIPTIAHTPWEY